MIVRDKHGQVLQVGDVVAIGGRSKSYMFRNYWAKIVRFQSCDLSIIAETEYIDKTIELYLKPRRVTRVASRYDGRLYD